MSLFLVETTLQEADRSKAIIEQKIKTIEASLQENGLSLIEAQVAKDYSYAFFIVETDNESQLAPIIEKENVHVALTKQVRLIGEDIDGVKRQKDKVNYVVEWNLPEHLTMEQYLARKEKNSVHYQEVPEVSFARTYVCEDMTKCLCFYDEPDQSSVEKAREAVQAPIDAITELEQND